MIREVKSLARSTNSLPQQDIGKAHRSRLLRDIKWNQSAFLWNFIKKENLKCNRLAI